jgi:hypothetical protein
LLLVIQGLAGELSKLLPGAKDSNAAWAKHLSIFLSDDRLLKLPCILEAER